MATTRKAVYGMMKRLHYHTAKPMTQKQLDEAAAMLLTLLSELEGCINNMAGQANILSTHANNIDRMLR